MQLKIRCSQLSVEPSDSSGFVVTAEVSDVNQLLREVIYGLDEAGLRMLFGNDRFEEYVRKAEMVIKRALRNVK